VLAEARQPAALRFAVFPSGRAILCSAAGDAAVDDFRGTAPGIERSWRVQGKVVTNDCQSTWQMNWMALRPDIAQTGTMPLGSTHWPHMTKSARPGGVFGVPRIFSGTVLNEGDDVEIAGVSNARNQWLEAARVHNHTTGAT
jgi:hypothetical protein